MTKRLWKTGGVALSASLLLSLLAPVAAAAPNDESETFTPQIQDVSDTVGFKTLNRLPEIEPGVVGTIPAAGTGLTVAGLDDGSALVRLSVFASDAPTQVSAAGAPVLQVPGNSEGSTTILVPVSNGHIPVSASAQAKVRVEVLASFAADNQTPGATIALPEAVKRAESSNELGFDQLPTTAEELSVVGIGGVPSQDVRAVYVTANLQLEQAGTVTISGQDLALPAGQSIITTIAVVSEAGTIEISSNVAGHLRLDVTGWVVGSAQNVSSANSTGSYVPTAEAQWTSGQVSAEAPTTVEVSGHSSRAQALALVSAEPTEGATRSFINVGQEASGRSRGVLVDPELGALPQIELVEVSTAQAALSVQGSSVDVNVLALGDIVGETTNTAGDTAVEIQAPESVDLGAEGEVLLQGEISSNAPVARVELHGNGQYIGTAAVRYSSEGANWQFRTAAPQEGEISYSATAIARDGSKASAETKVQVTIPDEDLTVISPDVVIVETNELDGYSEGTFRFGTEPELSPGDVLVADASQATPEGALGRVTSIQQTDEGWLVETEEATLTDVFLQADNESSTAAFTEGTELIAPEGDQGFEVIDEGIPNAELIEVEESALAPGSGRSNLVQPAETTQQDSLKSEYKLSGKAELAFTKGNESKRIDLSFASDGTKEEAIEEVKSSGGISFVGEVEAMLGLETLLKVEIKWSWGIPRGELTHFKSVFKGSFKAGYEAAVSGTYSEELSYEITKLKGAPVTVMVGPVPVVLVPGASLKAIGNLDASVSFSYGQEFNPTFEYGVEYKDGSWNPVRAPGQGEPQEPAQCVGWGSNVKASGEVSGQGGLELSVDVKIFGWAGPKASVSAEGKSTFNVTYDGAKDELSAALTNALVLAAALKVDAKIKIIGVEIGEEWEMARLERVYELNHELPIQLDLCANEQPSPNPDDEDDDGEEAADSLLEGQVTDAATTEPLTDVQLSFKDSQGETHNVTPDAQGKYSVALAYGQVFVSATADGYIPYSRTIAVPEGETRTLDIQLSRELESTQYRAVLTWGAEPSDLDSHLIGVDSDHDYHVYYGRKQAYDANWEEIIAELDVDDVTSYGPETTTFDVTSTGDYTFFIHNYSGSPSLAASGANVALYQGNNKIADFDVPAGGEELYWNVFRIQNGQLVILNNLSDEPGITGAAGTTQRIAEPGLITEELLDQTQDEIQRSNK